MVYWFNFAFLIPAEYCCSCKYNLYPDINCFLYIDFCVVVVLGFSHRIMLLRNNTLRIINSSRTDEGSYVCRADNQFGSAEMTAVLWVKGKWCPGGTLFSARLVQICHQETHPNVTSTPPTTPSSARLLGNLLCSLTREAKALALKNHITPGHT